MAQIFTQMMQHPEVAVLDEEEEDPLLIETAVE